MPGVERASLPERVASGQNTAFRIEIRETLEDRDWDRFLAQTEGGHHVQTSLWARVQAQFGWRPVRVLVYEGASLVAGVQILTRSFGVAGSIGNAIRGPVLARNDATLARRVVEPLADVVKERRIRHLIMQPAAGMGLLEAPLVAQGFRPSSMVSILPATVIVDLSADPERLLAGMHSKTRYNIRLGERKGLTVREGTADDLGTFYRLLVATSERQGFTTDSQAYFETLWDVFAPEGHIKLFLAEYDGEAVSAFLYIGFGDTLVYKRGAWSGQHGSKHPNELLHWKVMGWAKEQGYRQYDFDGITLPVAQAAIAGQPLPPELRKTVAAFKLGFGGKVVQLPPVYEQIRNPVLRWGYDTLFPYIKDSPLTRRLLRSPAPRGRVTLTDSDERI